MKVEIARQLKRPGKKSSFGHANSPTSRLFTSRDRVGNRLGVVGLSVRCRAEIGDDKRMIRHLRRWDIGKFPIRILCAQVRNSKYRDENRREPTHHVTSPHGGGLYKDVRQAS